jgi:hypothetical protein
MLNVNTNTRKSSIKSSHFEMLDVKNFVERYHI